MAEIKVSYKKDFSGAKAYLDYLQRMTEKGEFDKYGKMGVDALREATPKRTGKTSESWIYKVHRNKSTRMVSISWENTNKNEGEVIALLIQYGHGRHSGGYIPGRDYINPAMKPVFEAMSRDYIGTVTQGGKGGRHTFK